MAKKIKLGDYNRLRIVKKVDFGLYLDGGDEGVEKDVGFRRQLGCWLRSSHTLKECVIAH